MHAFICAPIRKQALHSHARTYNAHIHRHARTHDHSKIQQLQKYTDIRTYRLQNYKLTHKRNL